MSPNLLQIVTNTPLWVWVLLTYLIIIGIKATQKTTVSIYRLGIMPTVFIVWSLWSIHTKYGFSPAFLALYGVCLIIGIGISLYTFKKEKYIFSKNKQTVQLAGSYLPLVISLCFFSIKYSLGVMYALEPILKTNLFLGTIDIVSSGLISGISLGRLLSIITKKA